MQTIFLFRRLLTRWFWIYDTWLVFLYCMKVKIFMGCTASRICPFSSPYSKCHWDLYVNRYKMQWFLISYFYIFFFSGVCIPQKPPSLVCLLHVWQGSQAPAGSHRQWQQPCWRVCLTCPPPASTACPAGLGGKGSGTPGIPSRPSQTSQTEWLAWGLQTRGSVSGNLLLL